AAIVDQTEKRKPGYIIVGNVLQTLQDLASYHRKTLSIPVLAITGTNGKTTTKELIHAVLSKKFNVLATRGNFNNHIGVPLTLLGLKDEEMAVVEMGANHIGEIHELCTIADPDYGIITNIGFAHLEGFGSPEGVLQAKTELYRYLNQKKGTIFINGMNDLLTTSAESLNLRKVWYTDGKTPLVDGYIDEKSVLLKMMISFTGSAKYHVETKLTGNYNMENILAAACIGKYFGVPETEIISAIESYAPSNNRSQYLETDGNHLIIDAYNANPTSMNGAVKNFLGINAPSRMLILGDMLELGRYTEKEHLKIIEMLNEHPGIEVILVGPEFEKAAQNTGYLSFYVVEELFEHLRMNPVKDHLILLKGSRGIHLEKLIDVL
ncbi:MAG TPA: UDP-N-acetylmuramoyl-tripeptide--D-alanyl-D-alanine ligase, partial [Bacteroidales bacterium]|nr:UDP-N-acetylmuramoyl-tripeptide--D-alanyl-D-alanine ligase [Bacteroidales bacterium]